MEAGCEDIADAVCWFWLEKGLELVVGGCRLEGVNA